MHWHTESLAMHSSLKNVKCINIVLITKNKSLHYARKTRCESQVHNIILVQKVVPADWTRLHIFQHVTYTYLDIKVHTMPMQCVNHSSVTYSPQSQQWPTCRLMSAPACSSHSRQSGWPPNAAMWVGVWAKRDVSEFTPQPTCTRRIMHSSWCRYGCVVGWMVDWFVQGGGAGNEVERGKERVES